MVGIDTNILVRYLVQDDPAQGKRASDFIEKTCTRENPGFINHIVLCELSWVLESVYSYEKETLIEVLEKILIVGQFEIENKDNVWAALHDYKNSKADFSDCLIARKNRFHGCEKTVTFDKGLKNLEGVLLLGKN